MRAFLIEVTGLTLIRMLAGMLLPEGDCGKYADLGIGLLLFICMLKALFTLVGGWSA